MEQEDLALSSAISLSISLGSMGCWLILLKRRRSDSEPLLDWLSTNWILVLFTVQQVMASVQPILGLIQTEEKLRDKTFVLASLVFGDLSALYIAFSVLAVELFRFSVFWMVPDDKIFKLSPVFLRFLFLLQVLVSLTFVWGLSDQLVKITESNDNAVLLYGPNSLRKVSIMICYLFHVMLSLIFYLMFFFNVYRIKSDVMKLDQKDSKNGTSKEKGLISEADSIALPFQVYFQGRATAVTLSIAGNVISCLITIVIYNNFPNWTLLTNRFSISLSQYYIYQVTKLTMQMTQVK